MISLIVLISIAIIVLTIMIVVIFVVETEKSQFHKNSFLADSYSPNIEAKQTLVVYYSRSGNTEILAMEIAKHYKAKALKIIGSRYNIGYKGWLNATTDARNQNASIFNDQIDISKFDTIVICSPIWLYSPAPPIWAFIKNHDFKDKKVILFNSLNSRFKQHYINSFINLIKEKGGIFISHLYVIRGRMFNQIDTNEFLNEVNQKIGSLYNPEKV